MSIKQIKPSLISAAGSITLLLALGTVVFKVIEDWSWAESFYFSVASMTTVGYGDIHPTTDFSRIVAALYILAGVGIVVAALTRIGAEYLNAQEHQMSDNITRRIHRAELRKERNELEKRKKYRNNKS